MADTQILVLASGVAEAREGDGQRLSATKRHEVPVFFVGIRALARARRQMSEESDLLSCRKRPAASTTPTMSSPVLQSR